MKKDDLCVARLAGVLTTIRLLRDLSTSVNKYSLIKIFVYTFCVWSIADWLIRWKLQLEIFETEITFEKVKAFVGKEYQDEVLVLIEDLDLIIF